MKKLLLLMAIIAGTAYMFFYLPESETWQVCLVFYSVTAIGMLVTRYFSIAFTWVQSTFKVFLWAVPLSILYMLLSLIGVGVAALIIIMYGISVAFSDDREEYVLVRRK